VEDAEDDGSTEMKAGFSHYLHEYIGENNLRDGLTSNFTQLLVSCNYNPHH